MRRKLVDRISLTLMVGLTAATFFIVDGLYRGKIGKLEKENAELRQTEMNNKKKQESRDLESYARGLETGKVRYSPKTMYWDGEHFLIKSKSGEQHTMYPDNFFQFKWNSEYDIGFDLPFPTTMPDSATTRPEIKNPKSNYENKAPVPQRNKARSVREGYLAGLSR